MNTELLSGEYRRFPKHWSVIPFSEAFQDKTGGQVKIQRGEYLEHGKLPIIDQGQDLVGGYTNDLNSKCKISLPCVLFGDHTKIFKFIDEPFTLGADGVKVLKQADNIDPKFAYYFLGTLDIPDVGYSRHFRFLKRTFFPLPPLEEQRRIAAILDKADGVRRKRKAAIALTEDLLRSTFLDMFGDPVTNPKGWDIQPLLSLIKEEDRINYGVVQPGDHVKDGKPIVRVGDFKNGKIQKYGVKRISPGIEKQYVKSRLQGNEILISCVGSIGEIAIVDESLKGWNIVRAVARVPLKREIHKTYMVEYLRSSFVQAYFINETRTVSQPTLNVKQIKETPILLPPESLRDDFEHFWVSIKSQISKQEESIREIDNLFNSLLQRAFRGDL
ncbi:restriction endonuclease subunit S [Prochlorothrix hollandica]|uniref:restriction endonuclease subunit S n=1 Tax=Prochlorothrix hollandica TaxID=1223 RepID=UPI00034939C2|nr:restriction endonuclease subunit S [Prochlorothrix hollandica]